jgi:diguanylate cyclase (GGDEF)-like protein
MLIRTIHINTASTLIHSLGNLTKDIYKVDTVDSMISSIQTEMELLFGFSLTWLYAFEGNCKKTSKLISVVGKGQKEVESKYPYIDITNDKMMEKIFNSDFPVYVEDARSDPTTDKKIVNALDYRTLINCQLFLHGESLGLIGAGSFATEGVRPMSLDEVAYFSALSKIVSITLDRISYREKSLLDPLTKIDNKRGLEVNAETLLALARRNNQSVAIVFIDLDNFKPINDQFGHDVGDNTLISFSQCLKNILRRSDLVARVGGDEFVLLLSNVNDEYCIHKLIDQIDAEWTLLKANKSNLDITFSAGYSVFPENGTHLDELINLADKKMYQIKSISKSI